MPSDKLAGRLSQTWGGIGRPTAPGSVLFLLCLMYLITYIDRVNVGSAAPLMLIEAIVGQVLFLTPWIWAVLVAILVRLVRRGPRAWSEPEALLTAQALPALTLFLGVATFRRIMPHWPTIGFVALLPLLGRALADRHAARPKRWGRRLAAMAAFPMVLGSLFVAHARTGLFQDGRGRLLGVLPAGADPSVDTIRWGQIAGELARRGLLDDPGMFLFTDCWRFSAELAMAVEGKAAVACFHRDAREDRERERAFEHVDPSRRIAARGLVKVLWPDAHADFVARRNLQDWR